MKLILCALMLSTLLGGCAMKKVMKDCEQINETNLYMCRFQHSVY